jgi:hypothetical protein
MQEYVKATRQLPLTSKEKSKAEKRTKFVNNAQEGVAQTFSAYHPRDARLISIQMRLDNNHVIDTLIDSGSELDLIHQRACIQGQLPIDKSQATVMRDVGAHDTFIEGKCHNVNFTTGNLVTTTDVWVAGQLPFSLLLGRPWQRRNRISIDERETGTWLCRRDPQDRKIWETCAIPARHAEHFFESFPSHFFGKSNQLTRRSPDAIVAAMSSNPQLYQDSSDSDSDA